MGEFDINPNPFMPESNDGLPEPPKTKLNINDLTNLVCEECDHNLFKQLYAIKRISPIVSGAPKTQYVPIQVFACANCGELPEDFANLIK